MKFKLSAKKYLPMALGTIMMLLSYRLAYCTDQPQSTIKVEDDGLTYYLFNDPDGMINLSTSEVPNLPCPGDSAQGDPDYYWDFGPLDGIDNMDGTATILSDQEGTYNVTVSCGQTTVDSNGHVISPQPVTKKSSPKNMGFQKPTTLKFVSGAPVAAGGDYTFEVDDKDGKPIASQTAITLQENVSIIIVHYYVGTTDVFDRDYPDVDNGNASKPGVGTNGNGLISDVPVGLGSSVLADCTTYTAQHNGVQITSVKRTNYEHDYWAIDDFGASTGTITQMKQEVHATITYNGNTANKITVDSVTPTK